MSRCGAVYVTYLHPFYHVFNESYPSRSHTVLQCLQWVTPVAHTPSFIYPFHQWLGYGTRSRNNIYVKILCHYDICHDICVGVQYMLWYLCHYIYHNICRDTSNAIHNNTYWVVLNIGYLVPAGILIIMVYISFLHCLIYPQMFVPLYFITSVTKKANVTHKKWVLGCEIKKRSFAPFLIPQTISFKMIPYLLKYLL